MAKPTLDITDTALASVIKSVSDKIEELRNSNASEQMLSFLLASSSSDEGDSEISLVTHYPFDKRLGITVKLPSNLHNGVLHTEMESDDISCVVSSAIDVIEDAKESSKEFADIRFYGDKDTTLRLLYRLLEKKNGNPQQKEPLKMTVPLHMLGHAVVNYNRVARKKIRDKFTSMLATTSTDSDFVTVELTFSDSSTRFTVSVVCVDRETHATTTRTFPADFIDRNNKNQDMNTIESFLAALRNLARDEIFPVELVLPKAEDILNFVSTTENEKSPKVFERDVIGTRETETVMVPMDLLEDFLKKADDIRNRTDIPEIADAVSFFGNSQNCILMLSAGNHGYRIKAAIVRGNYAMSLSAQPMDEETVSKEELSSFLESSKGFNNILDRFSRKFWDGRKIEIKVQR